jgi:hypothetical protein
MRLDKLFAMAGHFKLVMFVVGLLVAGGLWFLRSEAGDWSNIFAYAAGLPIIATDRTQDLGVIAPGMTNNICFHLTNVSDTSVRIVGAKVTCGCIELGELPREIKESTTVELEIVTKAPTAPGAFSGKVILLTASELQPTIVLEYLATVEKPETMASEEK